MGIKYTYIEIRNTNRPTNARTAKLERNICGFTQMQIAEHIGCDNAGVGRWERNGKISITWQYILYCRVAEAIHNHVSVDYYPCPTLIKLAPEKWTKRRIMLMDFYRREL